MLTLLCSCQAQPQENSETTPSPAPVEETQTTDLEDTKSTEEQKTTDTPSALSCAELDRIAYEIIPDFGEPISFSSSDKNISYYLTDDFELFGCTGIAGHNTILAHRFSDDSWHDVNLGDYSAQHITRISTDQENPKQLCITVDGYNFHFDHMLNDFERTLRFDENFQNPEVISYGGSENFWEADLLDVASLETLRSKISNFRTNPPPLPSILPENRLAMVILILTFRLKKTSTWRKKMATNYTISTSSIFTALKTNFRRNGLTT